jgi:hypothetical protein
LGFATDPARRWGGRIVYVQLSFWCETYCGNPLSQPGSVSQSFCPIRPLSRVTLGEPSVGSFAVFPHLSDGERQQFSVVRRIVVERHIAPTGHLEPVISAFIKIDGAKKGNSNPRYMAKM